MYLVTQNNLYNKNLQQTPSLLCFYCKELLSRIPEQLDLLIYEFSTNFYWISKFTAKITKESLEILFICVYGYSNNPLGFRFFSTRGPWLDQNRGRAPAGLAGRFPAAQVAGGEGIGVEKEERDQAHL